MNANETTRRLIQGSENINTMRQEVNTLVKTLAGIFAKCATFRQMGFVVPTELGHWTVMRENEEVLFECWIKLCHPGDMLGYASNDRIPFHMGSVESVYRSLPALVEGLFQTIDGLEKSCRPLISASYVFETILPEPETGKPNSDGERIPTSFRTSVKPQLDLLAVQENTTVTELVNQAAREFLARRGLL